MKLNNYIYTFLVFALVFFTQKIQAQTIYYMTDASIEECEGIIKDSERARNGNDPTWYDHNEDYVFTICVPGTEKIELTFTFFQLEDLELDVLTIHDGPDINSPIIGTYTGLTNPGTIASTSDCLTLHFVSDASVAAPGWEAIWNAEPPPPTPPLFEQLSNVDCGSTSLVLNLDRPIDCNKVTTENFALQGPTGSISSVTPINCVDGQTTEIQVNFSGPLDVGGTYNIVFSIFYTDICFNVYNFDLPVTFDIINCPLEVEITGPLEVCNGSCITLRAEVEGGDFNNYQYSWSDGSTTQNISVCPTTDQTYTVTVTDGSSLPATDTHDVVVLEPPVAQDPDSLCWNGDPLLLTATPAGGTWSGPGVQADGTYNGALNIRGNNLVVYTMPNGCSDTTDIKVLDGYARFDRYACVSPDTLFMTGTPTGGTWSGPHIDAAGNFVPSTEGAFNAIYTAPTGCIDTAIVTVGNGVSIVDEDTTCVNGGIYQLVFSPQGGIWTGPGIRNGVVGTFDPSVAGIGNHELIYNVTGCTDTLLMEVINVSAGNDSIVCPSNAPFNLVGVPSGGVWSGDAVTGSQFDPGFNGGLNFADTLTYTSQGCVAQKIIYALNTTVSPDTLDVCPNDTIFPIDSVDHQAFPPGPLGFWSGNGVVGGNRINPAVLVQGANPITYTINGCSADYIVRVNIIPVAQEDTVICLEGDPFTLEATPTGGTWFNHVEDATGLFDPQLRGSGVWTAIYEVEGCVDTTLISVQNVIAQITSIPPDYCNTNVVVPLNAQPDNGSFFVVREQLDTIPVVNLIPSDIDAGNHELFYQWGSGKCLVKDSIPFEVFDSLKVHFPYHNDTICYGEYTELEVTVTGGREENGYEYLWEDPFKKENPVRIYADDTEYITLTVTDHGCSANDADSLELFVHGEIYWVPSTGDIVCYGDTNWAAVRMGRATRGYAFEWSQNDSVFSTTDSLFAPTGRYDLVMTDTLTLCELNKSIVLPGHPLLEANFIVNPEELCVEIGQRTQFIETAIGVESGYWDFGDGMYSDYIFKNNPIREYRDTGVYEVTLIVQNGDGMCHDTISREICITPIQTFFIENAFTPNDDGNNDVFPSGAIDQNGFYLPNGYLIEDYDLIIINRWGDEVYSTVGNDFKDPWNGRIRNTDADAPPGWYRYGIRVYFEGTTDALFKEGKVLLIR